MGNGIVRLALVLTALSMLVGIACQETAPQTLGEKVASSDGQAAYAKRADFLIQSIADACSFLTSEDDVLDMAIKTRDAFNKERNGIDVTILEVLEAANDNVMSSESRPVDCEEVFTVVDIQLIIEDVVAGQ